MLLGLVSLFADMTYEGARSITLAVLGASGTIVGLVAGFGEPIGYALRLVSVYLADRTGKYWAITIFGCADDPKQLARLLPHEWTSVIVRILCDRH
ncbi:MAG TPA: hypothetical protein VJ692_12270, partial [Nitrospiraceae bacterium]|nr:hypothetical protein [Nitrospiraceae bacterium]